MKTKWLTQDFTDKLFHRQGLVDSATFYLVNWAIFLSWNTSSLQGGFSNKKIRFQVHRN